MSNDVPAIDHRTGTRIPVQTLAQLRLPDGAISEASIRDASPSGAFIETRAPVLPLARVSVRATCLHGRWREACVVRVEASGMAVEWLDPCEEVVSDLLEGRLSPCDEKPERRETKENALQRAISEVDSGEFDVQG